MALPNSVHSPARHLLRRAVLAAVWAVGGVATAAAAPQVQVRVQTPMQAFLGGARLPEGDRGTPVEMFENANLDRYLRRAEQFLQRGDFAGAIHLLQAVAEGRTEIEVGGEAEPAATNDKGLPAVAPPAAASPTNLPLAEDDRYAVYATDGRLFRPLRRLGQQLLAGMPPAGLSLYRTLYDGDAERAFAAAAASGDLRELQAVTERYYASLAAGRALALLGDRFLHEGRYRAAVQRFRELLDQYPAEHRRQLGVPDTWLQFKIALGLTLAGDRHGARAALAELADAAGDATLRLGGDLHAVRELAGLPLFAAAAVAPPPVAEAPVLRLPAEALVPLWQFRFADPDPYREPANRTARMSISRGDDLQSANAMPYAGRYYPGSAVAFLQAGDGPPRLAFFEHFRLRIADALTGLQLHEGDGAQLPPAPRDGQPRTRIAACDFALQQVVEHDGRLFAVLGFSRKAVASLQMLRETELVAYDREGLARLWSSTQWYDEATSLREATLLAAPTPFGDRLLVPTLRLNVYALDCVDAATGRSLWTAPLHAGGSRFYKAPGVRVVVDGSTAFVASNAGCLAAVDAWSGELQWVRRYEREDPLRTPPTQQVGRQGTPSGYAMFAQLPLDGFFPSDLIVGDGIVVHAPIDGDLVMALDGATGQPAWLFDGASRYASFGRLRVLLGTAGDRLFACSDTHLVCFSRRSGILRWARELPPDGNAEMSGRGRGAVVGERVVVPGQRELLVFDLDGAEPMQRVALPPFGSGREPLAGAFHVHGHGPWLAIGYAGGVEVFSTAAALQLAAASCPEPLRRAALLQQAGDLPAAEAGFAALAAANDSAPGLRRQAAQRLASLVRQRALAMAPRDLDAALAILDARPPAADDREQRLQWHLARVDCARHAGNLARLSAEQELLYAVMEGQR